MQSPKDKETPVRIRIRQRLLCAVIAGTASGLYESAQIAFAAYSLSDLFFFFFGTWTMYICGALAISIPWILSALTPWQPHFERGSIERPGLETWSFALLLVLSASGFSTFYLHDFIKNSVADTTVFLLTICFCISFVAFFGLLTPLIACGITRITKGKRPSALIFALIATIIALVGAYKLHKLDARFTAFPLLLLGAWAYVIPLKIQRFLRFAPGIACIAFALNFGIAYRAEGIWFHGAVGATFLPSTLFSKLEALSDEDHDGHSSHFGGLDCDDHNSKVHINRKEIPNNGIDDNCLFGDWKQKPFSRPTLPAALNSIAPDATTPSISILLVVLDAWRADHFSPETTPHLWALAQKGTRFTHAFAPSSSTRYAMPALMSSRWIGYTDYREEQTKYHISTKDITIAQVLTRRGYQTQGMVPPFIHSTMKGIGNGFQLFKLTANSQEIKKANRWTAPLAIKQATDFIKQSPSDPFFLYLHLDDAHRPYSNAGTENFGSTDMEHYAADLRRVDRDLEPFLNDLQKMERPILIVVTADHGESFMEHGTANHGQNLYQEVIHVPLFFVGSQIPEGKVIDQPTDMLDVAPTLAELAGTSIPSAQGSSLLGIMQGAEPPPKRPLFAEVRYLHAPYPSYASALIWPQKLHFRVDQKRFELYDLEKDPEEKHNIFGQIDSTEIQEVLKSWIESSNGVAGAFSHISAL